MRAGGENGGREGKREDTFIRKGAGVKNGKHDKQVG